MRSYAVERVSLLLGRLVFEFRRSGKSLEADAVHDLRVAIRRFSRSLRVFGSLLPRPVAKKIRRRLNGVMAMAGKVRDRDIALAFLKEAGVAGRAALRLRILSEREAAARSLTEEVKRWNKRDFSSKWRSALELDLR